MPKKPRTRVERVMVSLPKPLVSQLRRFADVFRDGNKSGFIADAVQSHITQLRDARHTEKLRASYAAAVRTGQRIGREWESADAELWETLEDKKRKEVTPKKG